MVQVVRRRIPRPLIVWPVTNARSTSPRALLDGPGHGESSGTCCGSIQGLDLRQFHKEADRLGLGVSAMSCSGWDAGGPWLKPEQACKRHVHSEMRIRPGYPPACSDR